MDDPTTFVSIRVATETKDRFNERCEEYGVKSPSQMHRELMEAFADGRVKIEPTDLQRKQQELYNHE